MATKRSARDRLEELLAEPISLTIILLGQKPTKMETLPFSEIHAPGSVRLYPDGIEVTKPHQYGTCGQIYIEPLRLVADYFLATRHSG